MTWRTCQGCTGVFILLPVLSAAGGCPKPCVDRNSQVPRRKVPGRSSVCSVYRGRRYEGVDGMFAVPKPDPRCFGYSLCLVALYVGRVWVWQHFRICDTERCTLRPRLVTGWCENGAAGHYSHELTEELQRISFCCVTPCTEFLQLGHLDWHSRPTLNRCQLPHPEFLTFPQVPISLEQMI